MAMIMGIFILAADNDMTDTKFRHVSLLDGVVAALTPPHPHPPPTPPHPHPPKMAAISPYHRDIFSDAF